MTRTEKTTRVLSPGWIGAGVIGLIGILLAWLIYPLPATCGAVYGVPCPPDPRFLPAISGTLAILALWVGGTLLRLRASASRPLRAWGRVFVVLVVIAAVLTPLLTLGNGGY